MTNKINPHHPICILTLTWLILSQATSFAYYVDNDWNYHGSGRDHPYSAYIDRQNYIGYADYAPLDPDYIDGALYISNAPAPVITPASGQLITQVPTPPIVPQNEFTVNVPNNNGGYTPVVIKRSGNGFTGPQGEFYSGFPKVAQLKIMYGK